MSFISVFDVMGPNMIGPSSSHTAGAARIALLAKKLLTGSLKKVEFTLYGSFAKTYHGHGTDRALLGGIMGFATDDVRIRDSFQIATDNGIEYSFIPNNVETDVHPNTVDILMDGKAYCPSSPSDAQRRGVQTIFQQPALLPNLSVAEKPACAGSMVWRLILPENTARSSSSRKMHRALLLTLPNASVSLESISHSCVCSANPKEIPLIPS